MATVNAAYAASATITCAVHSTPLASSSTFVAGRASTVVDNTSNKYDDALLSGQVTVGTTPTVNTLILVYVWAILDDTPTYPDVVTGTDADKTLTSVGVGQGFLKLAAAMNVDATTSNRNYPFGPVSVAALFGGTMPSKWGLFVTHNTGVALNSTGSNHYFKYIGATYTVA